MRSLIFLLTIAFFISVPTGCSDSTAPQTPVTPPSKPPSELVVTQTSSTSTSLSWTDNSGGTADTTVLRSTDNVTFTPVATVPAGTTTYADTGLTADTTYYYEVTATNGGGSSSASSSQAVAVLGGLIFNFDAAQANGHRFYSSGGCASDQLTWYDLSPSLRNGALTGFQQANCGASSGWNGTGTTADPYRLDITNTHYAAGTTPPNYVYIDDSGAALNPSHITISAWVKPTSWSNGSGVVCKGTGAGGEVWCLDINHAGPPPFFYRFFLRNPSLTAVESGITPDTTKPQHVVATYDGSNVKIYYNGGLVITQAASGTLTSNTHQVSIGARQSSTTDYDLSFIGAIYQVQVFDTALSAARVSQLCKGLQGRFDGVACN